MVRRDCSRKSRCKQALQNHSETIFGLLGSPLLHMLDPAAMPAWHVVVCTGREVQGLCAGPMRPVRNYEACDEQWGP